MYSHGYAAESVSLNSMEWLMWFIPEPNGSLPRQAERVIAHDPPEYLYVYDTGMQAISLSEYSGEGFSSSGALYS